MKYRLYNEHNNKGSVLENFLTNRGINDCSEYLNLSDDCLIDYSKLKNMNIAVENFMYHFNKKNKITIVIDEDVDGFCSGGSIYSAIKEMDENYPVEYVLHTKSKAHGLNNIKISKDTKLLIIPDASTNDVKECRALSEYGMDIIILDHHEKEVDNPYAIIVNNQMSDDYENKDLCGAGIVYKFLQALDEENWTEIADNYLDLCSFANISDVMDMRSYETKYLVELGIKQMKSEGGNKFLKALIKSQEFYLNGNINIHNVQWSLTPKVNALIRTGTYEERDLLFRAFIEQDEFFEYNKRATKNKPAETVQENIYDRATRFCINAKGKQDRRKEKSIQEIEKYIKEKDLLKNEKCIVIDCSDILDSGLTGSVAIKISEEFKRPCILLTKRLSSSCSSMKYDEKAETIVPVNATCTEIVYGGSARNWDGSPIEDFKQIVNSTGLMKGAGHANAFGCFDLNVDDLDNVKDKFNYILDDIEYEDTFNVDYILDIDDVDISLIRELNSFNNLLGQGIPEPYIAIENITLNRDNIEIIGKKEDTIKFYINDIEYVQFKCDNGNELYDWLNDTWSDESIATINIVGEPCMNEYKGTIKPQIKIKDLEIISTSNNSDKDNIDDDFDFFDDEDW